MKEPDKYLIDSKNQGHLDDNEIALYADYLRHDTEEVPVSLIEHVESCSFCRTEIMAVADMLDALPDIVEETESPEYEVSSSPGLRRTLPAYKWLRSVAAVAAILLLAWIVQQFLPNRPTTEPFAVNSAADSTLPGEHARPDLLAANPAVSDSTSGTGAQADTLLYASAFIPNPTYENLVGAKYRSGNDPLVRGPEPGTVLKKGDTLKILWTPGQDDRYTLVLLDNRAKLVKELKLTEKGFLNWKIELSPGLYYWKFLGKNEMWKVGKFSIKAPL